MEKPVSEINPNHPVTQALHDQWHKILCVVMHKLGEDHVVITQSDLIALGASGSKCIVAHDRSDGLHIMVMDEARARDLAAANGGLPS